MNPADDPELLGDAPLDPEVRRLAGRARTRLELEQEVERAKRWERRMGSSGFRLVLVVGLVSGLLGSRLALWDEGFGRILMAMVLQGLVVGGLLILALRGLHALARHRRVMAEALLQLLPDPGAKQR